MKHLLRTLLLLSILAPSGTLLARDIEPPVPVRMVSPEYPNELRSKGVSGLVVLSCVIDDKGAVTKAEVTKSSNAAFNQPAIVAVEKWKFRPAQQDGKPVALVISLPIKFSNDGGS